MTNYELLYYILQKSQLLEKLSWDDYAKKLGFMDGEYIDEDAKEFLVHEFMNFIVNKLKEIS